MTTDERKILYELVEGGLTTDGAHHKQWWLEQIALQFDLHVEIEYERGIAP